MNNGNQREARWTMVEDGQHEEDAMTRAGFARIIVWAAAAACLLLVGCGSDESERDESVATARASLVDCEGIPEWTATSYLAGDRVQNGGAVYECKPFPFTGWCSQAAYEPGVSPFWQDAWTRIDDCDGNTPPPLPTTCDPSVEPCCPSTGFTEATLSEDANVFSSAQFGLCVRALGGSDTVMVGPAGYVIAGEGDDIVNGWGGSTVFPGAGADNVSVSSGGTVIILDASEALAGENLDGGGDGTLITPLPLEQLQAQGVVVSGFANVVVTTPGEPSGATSGPLTIRGRVTDALGNLVIGARVDLQGSEQAVRFTDFSGGYVFHVNPGSYSLRASGSCLISPTTVDLGSVTADAAQDFSASGPGCALATPSNVIATGEVLTLVEGPNSLGATFVHIEQRLDAADALARLDQISEEQAVSSQSLSILGHPAIQRETIVEVGKIVLPDPADALSPKNVALTTAIAIESTIVRFESRLAENADRTTIDRFLLAGRNFDAVNVPELHGPLPPTVPVTQNAPAVPPAPPVLLTPTGVSAARNGELQVAASDSSNAMVIATRGGPFFSLDAGATFQQSTWNTVAPAGAVAFNNAGDPFAAVGAPDALGNQIFYSTQLAVVTPGNPPTVAIGLFQSADNGQTFDPSASAFPLNCSTAVPGCTVPDQVQLAADRRNRAVGAGGQTFDQLYLAWRHVARSPGVGGALRRTTAIACSADGGGSWAFDLTTLAANTAADFPRIAVAPDGSLLVSYGIFSGKNYALTVHRFTSCANGLQPRPAPFPVKVADATNPVNLGGMPRQPLANYSIAASEDDATGNTVFLAYANQSSPGNDDIHVARSLDGGGTWPDDNIMNTVSSGNRYFPWICSTGSNAFVSWFDRRAGVMGASPDLTAYFRSSLLDNGARLGTEFNVSGAGFEDPQCLTGFPGGGATTQAAELQCTNLPNVAFGTGQCQAPVATCMTPPCGSLNSCDYRPSLPNTCLVGETCSVPAGVVSPGSPKYGDYVGSACARGRVFLAWGSGTPPTGACAVDGHQCTVNADCCSGNCVGGTCGPPGVACTPNGAACMAGLSCCSGSCQGGQCFPSVGIYAVSTSCTGDVPSDVTCGTGVLGVDLAGSNPFLTINDPFTICGTGEGFTPGGDVGVTYLHPTLSSETRIVGVADANGNVSFSDEQSPAFNSDCTEAEFAEGIVVVISDEATGETVTSSQVPTCFACKTVTREDGTFFVVPCPGAFNGGCD